MTQVDGVSSLHPSGVAAPMDATRAPTPCSPAEVTELIWAGADWIWETDCDLKFSWLSESYQSVTGIDPANVLDRYRFDFLSSEARGNERSEQHLADLQAKRPFRDFIYELKGADSRCRWISTTGFPRFDANGAFLGYRGIGRNVTTVVGAFDAPKAPIAAATAAIGPIAPESQASRMMAALNVMSDAFCYYDTDDRMVLFNAALTSMYDGLGDVIRPGTSFSELIDFGLERDLWDLEDVAAAEWRQGVMDRRRNLTNSQMMLRFRDGRVVLHREMRMDDGGVMATCTDVTELEDRQARLVKANKKTKRLLFDLERIIDSVNMGVLLLDGHLNAEMINQTFYSLWKLNPADFAAGCSMRALMEANRHRGIYAVEDAQWEDYVASRIAEIMAGEVAPREFARADGCTIIYSVTALSGGKRLLSYYDVTGMKQRESALHDAMRQLELFRQILDELPVATNVKSQDLTLEYVNNAWCQMTGISRTEAIGRTDLELFGAAEAAGFTADDTYTGATGAGVETEESITHRDGTVRQAMTRKRRLQGADGTIHLFGSSTDISELKARETLLQQSLRENEVFRSLIDNLPVAIYAKKSDLKLLYVNKGWCDLTGFDQEFALGKTDIDIFGKDGEAFTEADRVVLQSGEAREFEETVSTPDGAIRCQVARKGAFEASDGTRYLIGSSMDVTEQKQREADLLEAQRRAVVADRAKSEFLANMSHEIRTPMNGVLGMAELLAKSNLDPKQRTFTDIIVKSGNALLTIINDILDFSKIDAGQLTLDPAPFNLSEAIEDVATLISTRAKEKDLELIVHVAPNLHNLFVGDVGRFRQIVTNLIGNAVKFTDSGHVLVDVTGAVDAGIAELRIAVTDTGIGIAADKLDLVFEKFSQADASSTRRHEGTGLGLAITARLVELMGGKIGVESTPGKGSTFWFTLSLADGGKPTGRRPMPVDVTGSRILIVDDNAINRTILLEQMASWEFDACATASGAEGLAVLEVAISHDIPVDCVVLDYQMPGMSGLQMASLMRAEPRFATIPIVMLTSVDQTLGSASFRDLQIDAQLIKPARSSTLLETLVESIQRNRARRGGDLADGAVIASVGPAYEPPAQAALRLPSRIDAGRCDILVAEDNEVNQLVFTQILAETSLTFQIVGNGRLAVEAFAEMQPALVLMDISMPEMNGFEATAAIRALEQASGRHTPIIGVTAHALKGDRERCIDAGMDDYLPKPISPKALLDKIDLWSRQIRSGRRDVG